MIKFMTRKEYLVSNYIKVITYSEDKDFSINSIEKNGTLLITSTKRNSKDSLVVYLPADFYADDITIESTSGKIDCSHLWTENLFVSAVSGNVSLDKIDASYLDASAVSGNLNIKECYVENPVHLSTISGNLVFIGEVPWHHGCRTFPGSPTERDPQRSRWLRKPRRPEICKADRSSLGRCCAAAV